MALCMDATAVHIPVMPREVLHSLQLREGLTVMDGTLGAAGHSVKIRKAIGQTGTLIGFDRDPMMLEFASSKLNHSNDHLIHDSYRNCEEHLAELAVEGVDRVLLDLGLSSDQLADRGRGFGFDAGGPLDMRFDTSSGQSAAEILNTATAEELTRILADFGEEPAAAKIAQQVVQIRRTTAFRNTSDLEACVASVVKTSGTRNPSTRVFQALRIAVNQELEHVSDMMTQVLPRILKPSGIAVILTFHSLEDRLVKTAFKGQQTWQILNKKPVESTPAEIRINPRSRSAKLRAAMRKNE